MQFIVYIIICNKGVISRRLSPRVDSLSQRAKEAKRGQWLDWSPDGVIDFSICKRWWRKIFGLIHIEFTFFLQNEVKKLKGENNWNFIGSDFQEKSVHFSWDVKK